MDEGFCVSVLERALRIHGKPEIFNTDPGVTVYGGGLYWGIEGPRYPYQHACLPVRQGRKRQSYV